MVHRKKKNLWSCHSFNGKKKRITYIYIYRYTVYLSRSSPPHKNLSDMVHGCAWISWCTVPDFWCKKMRMPCTWNLVSFNQWILVILPVFSAHLQQFLAAVGQISDVRKSIQEKAPTGVKWFRYRVSIHHPLGSNWHPLESAGIYSIISYYFRIRYVECAIV